MIKRHARPPAGNRATDLPKRSRPSTQAKQATQAKQSQPKRESQAPTPVTSLQLAPMFSERTAEPPPWSALTQAKGGEGMATPGMDEVARGGLNGAGFQLPYLEQIQRAFGRHDVSGVSAHTDASAQKASLSLGAAAYTRGSHVAFGSRPSLHTAAHEAAHTVQQRSGLKLAGGMGKPGDLHEKHADAVADRVVRGESAEALLDAYAAPEATSSPAAAVQMKSLTPEEKKAIEASFENLFFTTESGKRVPKPNVTQSESSGLLIELLYKYNPDDDSTFLSATLERVEAEYRDAQRAAASAAAAPQSAPQSAPPTPTPTPTPAPAPPKDSVPSQEEMLESVRRILAAPRNPAPSIAQDSKSGQQSEEAPKPQPKLSRGDQDACAQFIRMLRSQIKLHFAMVDLIAGSTKTGVSAGLLLADIFSFGISTVGTVPARAAMAAVLMSEHTARKVTSIKLFNDINQMTPSQLMSVGMKCMTWPLKSPYFYELAAAITQAAGSTPVAVSGALGTEIVKQAAITLTSEAMDTFGDYLGDLTGAAADFIPGADLVGGGVKITKAGFEVKTYTAELEQLRQQFGK